MDLNMLSSGSLFEWSGIVHLNSCTNYLINKVKNSGNITNKRALLYFGKLSINNKAHLFNVSRY
jgi:hypothetical protein